MGHVYQQKLEEVTFRLSAVSDTLVFMMMSSLTSPGVVYP